MPGIPWRLRAVLPGAVLDDLPSTLARRAQNDPVTSILPANGLRRLAQQLDHEL